MLYPTAVEVKLKNVAWDFRIGLKGDIQSLKALDNHTPCR